MKTPARSSGEPRLRRVRSRRITAVPPRAARLPSLIGLPNGLPGMEARLGALSILHVGCGAVGAVAAKLTARLQPRRMVLVDPKRVSATTSLTSPAFGPADERNGKARQVAREAAAVSPATEVLAFEGPAQALPLAEWLEADVVVLAADNLSAEVFTGEMCHRLCRPLVVANVHGPSLVAQVRLFSNAGPATPCPECGFSAEELRLAESETRFSCDGSEPAWPGMDAPPTRSTAHLCSLAGGLAVNQLLRLVLGLGQPVGDMLLEFCGFNRQTVVPLRSRSSCRCDHATWEPRTLAGDPSAMAIAELAREGGFDSASPTLWATVDGRGFVERGYCSCDPGDGGRPVHRFLHATATGAGLPCPACGETLRIAPFDRHARVTGERLGPRRAWSLRRLGARPGEAVVMGDAGRVVVFAPASPAHRPAVSPPQTHLRPT